jgi:hypothetical protein
MLWLDAIHIDMDEMSQHNTARQTDSVQTEPRFPYSLVNFFCIGLRQQALFLCNLLHGAWKSQQMKSLSCDLPWRRTPWRSTIGRGGWRRHGDYLVPDKHRKDQHRGA